MKMFFSFLLLVGSISVQGQGINFVHDTTWTQITQRSVKENKPVFIDCYATWCGPCKWMAKNIFTNDTVGKYFNENFISVKMDMEKGDGKFIASRFKINAYPTFLYLAPDGSELHRLVGSMPAAEFIAKSKVAFDEKNRLSSLKARYQLGSREPAFIREYISASFAAGIYAHTEMDWYVATLPDAEFISKENLIFLFDNFPLLKEAGLKRIYANKQVFIAANSAEKLNTVVLSWSLDEVQTCVVTETYIENGETKRKEVFKENLFAALVKKVNELNPDNKTEVLDKLNYRKYQETGDIKNQMLFLKNQSDPEAYDLNQVAWEVYETSNDTKDLELALELARRSVSIENKYYNNDTCAALAYKLKKKKDAKKFAQTAISLAKEEGSDATSTEELLKKINELK